VAFSAVVGASGGRHKRTVHTFANRLANHDNHPLSADSRAQKKPGISTANTRLASEPNNFVALYKEAILSCQDKIALRFYERRLRRLFSHLRSGCPSEVIDVAFADIQSTLSPAILWIFISGECEGGCSRPRIPRC
jgi:hypothetical protein